MSDEVDIANENVEFNTTAAIEACRLKPTLVAKGSCWFCDEPVLANKKFCDRDCACDYEREQAAYARCGRPRTAEVHAH